MTDEPDVGGSGEIVAGTAQALGQVIGQVIQNQFNAEQAQKQRDWSEDMFNKQNTWNMDFWELSNLYNTPSEQVKRLRDAGLNPLYYGVNGVPAAPMQSASPLAYERANMANYMNPVGVGLDAALKVAQVSNIQADTAKKGKESLSEVAKREQMLANIENLKQDLLNKRTQQGLDEARIKEIDKALEWADRLNASIVSERESSAKLNDVQRNRINVLLEGEKLLQSKTLEDFEYRWSKIDAEISKMAAEENLLVEDLENYALNHAQTGFAGTSLSLANLIRSYLEWKESSEDYSTKSFKSSEPSHSGVR